jgi:hypothetical protein
MKKFIFPVLAIILSGCGSYVLVPPQKTTVVGITVEPSMAWNGKSGGGNNVWTVDGLRLQSLVFINTGNGDSLVKGNAGESASQAVRFHKDMTEVEIMDLFISVVAKTNENIPPTPKNLKKYSFAGGDGFRFEYSLKDKHGLNKSGIVVGRVANDRLYSILYEGESIYYYNKTLEEVERIISSAKISDS